MNYDNHLEIQKMKRAFEMHKSKNLKYPKLSNLRQRFIEVELEFKINEEIKVVDLKTTNIKSKRARTLFQKEKHIKSNNELFVKCAKDVIENFGKWKSFKLDDSHVDRLLQETIHFSYHSKYFIKQELSLIHI